MGKKAKLKKEQQNKLLAAMENDLLDSSMRLAELMSEGVSTLPKHLQGKRADCHAIIMQARRWNMDPGAVAQATSLINGTLAYSAQLVNAVVVNSHLIDGPFYYEYSGDWKSDKDTDAWVKCGAQLRGRDSITWGEKLYPATVITKNSPLWKSHPKQQAAYLAVKYWSRLYTPGAILGVLTPDEARERTERDITPAAAPLSALRKPSTNAKAIEHEMPDILSAIDLSKTVDELKSAGEKIGELNLSVNKKSEMRSKYAEKLNEIKSAN